MSEANNSAKFFDKLKFLSGDKYNWTLNPNKNDLLELGEEFYKIFENLSKKGKGRGYPDLFLYDKTKKIVIIAEVKEQIINHGDDNDCSLKNKQKYAVDGVKHYLQKIIEKNSSSNLGLNFIGLALSGDVTKNNNYKISTFSITKENKISDSWSSELLNVTEYSNYFKNIQKENNLTRVKNIASEVHELMRDLPVAERPIFLAGIVISLYENSNLGIEPGGIKKRIKVDSSDIDYQFIKTNLKEDIKTVLTKSGISPIDKIESVNGHISKILTILRNKSIAKDNALVRDIFIKVNSIMDVLTEDLEYEIMGNFYQEFLRYSTGDGGDLGIILTPSHITELMVELLDIFKDGGINEHDIVLDPCCGTGTFLISFMNKQIKKIGKNDFSKINVIKQKNLIGVEINPTMYVLAIANMLVRGDGKSSIFEDNIFTINPNKIKNKDGRRPSIGLMNPPYSQSKKKKSGNNKSEMEFIEQLLNNIENNGYAAVITSKSTFFKNQKNYILSKERIYKHNTLKAVINMPKDLFEPNASTHTTIAIFQVGKPHGKNDKVYFYNLDHDGFKVLKNNRIDLYNKWFDIKENFIQDIKEFKIIKGKSEIVDNLSYKDEWIPEAWITTNFNDIIENGDEIFDKVIKEYTLFKYKEKTGILNAEIDYKNETSPSKKEELKNNLLSELELFEQIQKTGLNALKIIENGEENE